MTLDDAEKLALELRRDDAPVSDLARALLAVLPVVRAADAWADDDEIPGSTDETLGHAVIAMRAALEKS